MRLRAGSNPAMRAKHSKKRKGERKMVRREFNVRVVLDEKNDIHLGFVQGFYKKGKEIIMQDVPESVREGLAKKINAKLLAKVPSQTGDLKT